MRTGPKSRKAKHNPKDPEACPGRSEGTHCDCWWDGEACCSCDAPAMTEEQQREQGMIK